MVERIDEIKYENDSDGVQSKDVVFFDGPAEFLVQRIAHHLKEDEVWFKIFGEFIDPYMRMDYSLRNLPALRLYNLNVNKDYESWFVEGEIKADIILPASLRRNETQQIQDSLSSALLQQFRRPNFFKTMCEKVPGLNELGKRFQVDKSLGFDFETTEAPLTQITLNFRLDLRAWDQYLEDTYRTKDSPYAQVLADLEKLVAKIEGLKDDNKTTEVTVDAIINTTGE